MALEQLLKELPAGGRVLDVGCLGLEFYRRCKRLRPDLRQSACDIIADQARELRRSELLTPQVVPDDLDFKVVNVQREALPFASDSFDLVVASHIIEHVNNPVEFFGELVRVSRPGGLMYVEAPSDRSTWLSFPRLQNWHLILSYYDDPTHTGRPWTPQSFYRLALFYSCRPVACRYDSSWLWRLFFIPVWIWAFLSRNSDLIVTAWWKLIGWACYIVVQKPHDIHGKPAIQYRSFKGLPPAKWGY